jgi:hypothetical protein
MMILLGAVFALVLFLQIADLVKKKERKVLVIYCILMAAAVFYTFAVQQNWNIPRPTELIIKITKPIAEAIYGDLNY